MIIMPIGDGPLGIYVLPQGGTPVARLQVVGGQGVTRQDAIHKALPHQSGERRTGIRIKSAGRAHDPDDVPMVALML